MEFPTLGNRCAVSNCGQLDFLPVSCSSCSGTYCKDHYLPFQHSCPSADTLLPRPDGGSQDPQPPLPVCALPSCRTKELVEMLCPHCQLHFCLQHRHQVDHQCSHYAPPPERMVQTAALVQQIQQKNAGKKPTRQGVKSDQLAAKVQLMKLKQKSKGLAELPAEERVYFLVELPLDGKAPEAVFVSNLWSVGKCVDYIASVCRIPNHNNQAGRPHLALGPFRDQMDAILKDLLQKQELFNGQTITLHYVEKQ